ncbi:MAG: hypothetical protein DWQ54_15325 [Microcystis flos-aquae TF09]|uniref:Uncharacterized protein n=1 Tax=Microcystis flos-aquae TF09 TaxID=2060473 RepID=A0A3E0L1Z2_9CHRO|nr:MAG: hypothetical protein DWQ54_15325 [Microcystis flos-aquae TF09]
MKGRSPRLSAPPLSRVDPPAYRHPPYQGGRGGSNLKSIFNLIITSYLELSLIKQELVYGFWLTDAKKVE